MAGGKELPKGMLTFHQLPISKSQRTQLAIMVLSIATIGLISTLLIISLETPGWSLALLILSLALGIVLIIPNQLAIIRTPLAVNMNHPFVDDEPIGSAEVYVRLSDGNWIKPGLDRLRLNRDELRGGFNLIEDNVEYTTLGHFSQSKNAKILHIQLTLINQALSLRDVVNEEKDTIEDARVREGQESGLLEREWLEDEVIQISGPASKLIGRSK